MILKEEEFIPKILEYRNNPSIFCKEQCKIKHVTKGLVPFVTFPAQDRCMQDFLKHRFNIILKSRQIGISTVVAGYISWKLIFFPHQEIRVIATKAETSKIIITMAYNMIDSCDQRILSVMGASRTSLAKHTISLANGSKAYSFGQAKGDNPDTGVGTSLSLLVVDECLKSDTKIKVKNKFTNEIREINISDLYNDEYK